MKNKALWVSFVVYLLLAGIATGFVSQYSTNFKVLVITIAVITYVLLFLLSIRVKHIAFFILLGLPIILALGATVVGGLIAIILHRPSEILIDYGYLVIHTILLVGFILFYRDFK